MNFRKPRDEDPEINLIPFIDVLLVVLIFLMLSTTYSKFTELQVNLPTAEADWQRLATALEAWKNSSCSTQNPPLATTLAHDR